MLASTAPPIETGIGDYGYGACGLARVCYSWMTFADFPTELGVLGAGEDFIEKVLECSFILWSFADWQRDGAATIG